MGKGMQMWRPLEDTQISLTQLVSFYEYKAIHVTTTKFEQFHQICTR